MANFKLKESMDRTTTGIADSGKNILPLSGQIIPFAGSTAPSGWVICDGTNGTPNLNTYFILGAGSGITPSANLASIGTTNHGHAVNYGSATVTAASGSHSADSHSTLTNTDSANHAHTIYGAFTSTAASNQTNYVNNPNGTAITTTPVAHTHNTNQWTVGTNTNAGFTHYHNIGFSSSQIETAHDHPSSTPTTTLSDSALYPAWAGIIYIMKV
jgi:microcystin-dependent protein